MHQYYTEKESFPPLPFFLPRVVGMMTFLRIALSLCPLAVAPKLPPHVCLLLSLLRPENAYDEIVACNAVCMPKKYGIANKSGIVQLVLLIFSV